MTEIVRNRFEFGAFTRALMPFADAAATDLPLGRLLRLSLFQVSVGLTLVLLGGTLNRVMAVELGIPLSVIAVAMALPLISAPARALIGFKSDNHRSYLGWRRVPYIWFGSLIQFGGLTLMPVSLLIIAEDMPGTDGFGEAGMALAFLMVGAGMHTVQTAGLALAMDLAPPEKRPRVVAMLYTTLLLGMFVGAVVIGQLLADFTPLRLIQILNWSAIITCALTAIAIWKQEPRRRDIGPDTAPPEKPKLREAIASLAAEPGLMRLLVTLAFGTAAFGMQDILLEPYGGEVLGMRVGSTTLLTALFAAGSFAGYLVAARVLARGGNVYVVAAVGLMLGLPGFSAVILSAPFGSVGLFCAGTAGIGLGAGLFSVSMLIAAMGIAGEGRSGLVLGAWGAVQAMALGLAVAFGGFLRDGVGLLADAGWLGAAFSGPAAAYGVVYHFEIGLLFLTLAALGPLVVPARVKPRPAPSPGFGLADLPN
ncbi:MAG: BCD family MFS transporter [Aurantimonas endophytica]|uniref:BCD family chlorophyll transporter-like MFS transporter n=1 Tax=Aurantimonas endophytica TaxID=1522175 RepID=A0A7W6HB93_9HYPH|nr:BCD family MFS transporter [Aurantimonas endophytica]MBB4001932.1 BCD family chlorophyll transporter-like MFS transporter [Aurantimonas endophytica]MCO6402435.1 MFS transporter [Aurantimonas endophytica]